MLIAGGWFTTAGGVTANRIASWDGSSWSPLGSGMNDVVSALKVYNKRLIAGGEFTIAGDKVSAYLAAWDKLCCIDTRGDVNGDGDELDIVDLTCVVDFMFSTGCNLPCPNEADLPTIVANVDHFLRLTKTVVFVSIVSLKCNPNSGYKKGTLSYLDL